MNARIRHLLKRDRAAIIEEWVDRLITTVGDQYAERPRQELCGTVTQAYDAYADAILEDDYQPINRFIDKITRMRLEAGFKLSDVQKAFELFRQIVVPRFAAETTTEGFLAAVTRVNCCLAYTIHRFSDRFQSMHEKKILENRVRENERMATIGQITTSLSHEIRNPLSAVKMNLQILKKNKDIRGNDQRRIDISVGEVKRLEGILEELLDYAKPLQLNYGEHAVNRILTASVELMEARFKARDIAVAVDLAPENPEMTVDREKLVQAVINILLNALEASPAGAAIEIGSRIVPGGDGGVEVTIADEGHGVPERHLPGLFKPFFTTKSKGTGLGLSNARRIIEAHGGRIEGLNRRPRGAVFNIFLPRELIVS